MNISELELMTEDFVRPDDVAPIIKTDCQSLRQQAKTDPSMLGFPVCVIGRKIYIPRMSFIKWVKGE